MPDINKVIHEPARLNIIISLYIVEECDFLYLMHQTQLSKGNLSSHLSKLEQSGYVEIIKTFKGKKPNTVVKLSSQGRQEFEKYRKAMGKILDL